MDEKLLKLSCIIDRKASDCELLQSRYDGLVDEDKKLEDRYHYLYKTFLYYFINRNLTN